MSNATKYVSRMPRLRREESQARTRELLVSIAKKLFLRDGYQSTSIEKVATEAGFSKGAVYSNFASKDELCLAVLASLRADEMRAIGQAWSAAHTFDERLAAFTAWAERMIGDTGWTLLEVEFGLSARQNRRLRAELAAHDARGSHCGRRGAAHGVRHREHATEQRRGVGASQSRNWSWYPENDRSRRVD
jgi:AcrR family transcriptional regulator